MQECTGNSWLQKCCLNDKGSERHGVYLDRIEFTARELLLSFVGLSFDGLRGRFFGLL